MKSLLKLLYNVFFGPGGVVLSQRKHLELQIFSAKATLQTVDGSLKRVITTLLI